MNLQMRNASLGATVLAGMLLLTGALAVAGDNKKPAPPPKPAPAPHPAPASHPAAGGATHGTTAGGATHGTTTTGTHPTTTTTGTHPTTTTTGTHPTTTTTGTHPTTTTTGAHPSTTTGAHPSTTGTGVHGTTGAGHTPAGTTPSRTAISKPVPKGVTEKTTKEGSAIRTRPNGKVSDVHDAKRGMDIHHGLDGSRKVTVTRKDGSKIVAEKGRASYVQRNYSYHNTTYVSRSYYYHGVVYNSYYRGYYGWGGAYYSVYAPAYYYGPGYYGWAYNPWAVPVAYGWGWGGNPWYGYYGGYFAPYPVYPSAAFWLTDYLIAANLQAAYAARQAAAAEAAASDAQATASAPALTPEIKQQIADEVKAQIALENQEAAQTKAGTDVDAGGSSIARLLSDGKPHAFVVGDSLDVTDSTGAECGLTDGDALGLSTAPASDATNADLTVLASKGGKECGKGATVWVALTDLQEMQNHLRESIDKGLAELKTKQGTGGLPAAPPSAQAAPAQSPYAAVAPPPAPTDATDIQQQTTEADKAETEVSAAAQNNAAWLESAPELPTGPGSAPAGPNQELGQAMEVVETREGMPSR